MPSRKTFHLIKKFLAYFEPTKIEDSIPVRLATLAGVFFGVLAVAFYGKIYLTALICFLLIIFGHYYSFKTRYNRPEFLRPLLAFFMIIAVGIFFIDSRFAIFGGMLPQGKLILLLLAITSFELPYRRYLYNSLLISLILIYIACFLSRDLGLFIFLIGYLFGGCLVLTFSYLADKGQTPSLKLTYLYIRLIPAFFLLSLIIFLFIPRLAGTAISYPISSLLNINLPYLGTISSPNFPLLRLTCFKSPRGEMSFDSELDLRIRGVPTSEIIMYVRCPVKSLVRGLAFDHYTGWGWKISSHNLKKLTSHYPPIEIDWHLKNYQATITQSYFLEKRQPNIIFNVSQAWFIYFPSQEIYLDELDSLRSPVALPKGTTYTIVSQIRTFKEREIESSLDIPQGIQNKYLQLPKPYPKIFQLAKKITQDKENNFSKTKAICHYLQKNFSYDLSIPQQIDKKDSVEKFLFAEKKGYCEHFASALCVLLRTIKVPCRMVSGYVLREYNLITGYFTVRSSDAHSWVEVYFPGYGWVSFDPTPNFSTTPFPEIPHFWLFSNIFQYIPKSYINVFSETGAEFLQTLFLIIKIFLQILIEQIKIILIFLIITLTMIYLRNLLNKKLKQRAKFPLFKGEDKNYRLTIYLIFLQMLALLNKFNYPQYKIYQTPREYQGEIEEYLKEGIKQVKLIINQLIKVLYSPDKISREEIELAKISLKELKIIINTLSKDENL